MSQSRFRIKVDGSWSAKEMGDLFQSCETIYGHFAQFHSLELFREHLKQSQEPTPAGNDDGRDKLLRVTAISYASPGWADFLGAGELTGHLKEFILGIIDRIVDRKDREQERQLRSAQIEAVCLENYANYLDVIDRAFNLASRPDINDAQRSHILNSVLQASKPLGRAVAEGRITAVDDRPDQ